MSTERERAVPDPIFLALTRPPMLAGVTDVYLVLMMIVTMVIFLGVGGGLGIVYAIVFAPVFFSFGYVMCREDARIFDIWLTHLSCFALARRRATYWGGSSFDPMPCANSRTVRKA